jgi:hypothetical protein
LQLVDHCEPAKGIIHGELRWWDRATGGAMLQVILSSPLLCEFEVTFLGRSEKSTYQFHKSRLFGINDAIIVDLGVLSSELPETTSSDTFFLNNPMPGISP